MLTPLSVIVDFKTGRLDSNASVEGGAYPFFTCSPTTLSIDTYAFDTEVVLLAGNNANGIFPVKYYNGKFNVYQRTYVITPIEKEKVSVRWLYFRIQHVTSELKQMSVGTATKFLTRKILDAYEVLLPPFKEQERVADILWSIQNKIDINRQTNQTLEQIAQAIFKSWFVDFEPTRAKIIAKEQGADPATQELAAQAIICGAITLEQLEELEKNLETTLQQAINEKLTQGNQTPANAEQLKATAALFPNELVESELGAIPDGWEVSTLSEHFNVVMGQSPKGDTYNEKGDGMLFFQGRRDFSFRYPEPRVYTTAPNRLAQAGDTLISVRAPVGDRNMAAQECCLGRGLAGIRHKSGARSFTYAFIGYIEKSLGDSGSAGTVFSSINRKELERVGFVAPAEPLLEAYEQTIYPIDQKVEVLSKETKALEELRDTLLPKLLSGELTVSDSPKPAIQAEEA